MKKFFKSLKPIRIKTERGDDFIQIEGEVKEIKGQRVFLKGINYDFSISKTDFDKHNIK